ncbi:MAG TPA: DinB family protein [Vicinamibacteria bacterium]|nr:DinB family protein [Vicinamibacteria bacterium]
MGLSAEERNRLIEQYARGPRRLREALGTVPTEALRWRPGPGRWSAHEVVVHCADSETNAALRIRYLLAENEPLIVGYDQAEWARVFDYHSQSLEDALAATDLARRRTVPLLRSLDEAQWSRRGRHTESGPYGAEDWLRSYAVHLEGHAGQIEKNLAAWKASTSSR